MLLTRVGPTVPDLRHDGCVPDSCQLFVVQKVTNGLRLLIH